MCPLRRTRSLVTNLKLCWTNLRGLHQHPPNHGLTQSSSKRVTPKAFSQMPGLKGIPLLGTVLMYNKMVAGKSATSFTQLHSKFGPIYRMRMLGNKWYVYVSSPEAAEEMFRAEGKCPSRAREAEEAVKWMHEKSNFPSPMFFAGLIVASARSMKQRGTVKSTGEVWKQYRSDTAKQVIPRRVRNFVEPLCVVTEDLLSYLETLQDEVGNVQDIVPELNKWGFQSVAYFVYGEKIDTFLTTDPNQKEFIEAAIDFVNSISGVASGYLISKLFPPQRYRVYMRSVKRMQDIGEKILDHRYDQIKDDIARGEVDETKAVGILDQWLIEGKFTREEALTKCSDILAGGVDTTSITASFLLYEIAKHPEIQERLVEEISCVVGEKEHPSWDDLQKMTLLRNCLKEVMRMYVPSGSLYRTIPNDAEIFGYEVPGGTTVVFNAYLATKDSLLFDDPKEFKPDRWSKDSLKKIHTFSSLPFGFGPRSCYGRRLAELELYILVAKMIPKYRLTTNVNKMKLILKPPVRPSLPLHIQFHKRQTM